MKRLFRGPYPLLIFAVAMSLVAAMERGRAASLTSGGDSIVTTVVRPGVIYKRILDPRGPWKINILEIDITRPDLRIGSARAFDKLFGRERSSSIAQRHTSENHKVIAAINADFFSLKTGEIENNQIIDGEFVKGTKMTGSPFDTFDNIHSQFGIKVNGKPVIERFEFRGSVSRGKQVLTVLQGVNDVPRAHTAELFNAYYGANTPTDTLKMSINELPLRWIASRGDTQYVIVAGSLQSGGTPLSKGNWVMSGYDLPGDNSLFKTQQGDTLKIWLGLFPDKGSLETLVGGWPRIVLDGKNIAHSADSIEGTFPRFSATRHPRTGVGFSRDSSTVYFFAIDGRQESGVGMSLVEFADCMLSNGVFQGMNLDGGGSTTLVIDGKVVNSPSDPTGERAVGNCLLLIATDNQH